MPGKEYLIKLCKAAYYKYKVISRGEYIVIHEAATGVDPESKLFRMI